MRPTQHRVPAHVFAALARGGGGGEAVRLLIAARRSRTLLLIRDLIAAASACGHPDALLARQAYQVLGHVQHIVPHAVDRVLDYPSVGAWATRTALLLRRGPATDARPGDLAAVAAAAAVRGSVTITIPFVTDPSRRVISLPSLGTALLPGASAEILVRSDAGGTELVADTSSALIPVNPHQDGTRWRGIPRIEVGSRGHATAFLLDGWTSGHLPPELRARLDVSAAVEVERWRSRLAEGWDLLVHRHYEVADELAAMVAVLTPLPTPPSGLASATLADAFGCVFLSLPPDARSVAVTLAHELQHAKLAAVMDLFPLLEAQPNERFYAPWRNDPRPLVGLLHGTYAHLGVTAFWRRQRRNEDTAADARHAHTEFARWRHAARDIAHSLLASGRLTATGRSFVSGMAQMLDKWNTDPVPDEALALAERLAKEHRTRWLAAHTVAE